MSSKETEDIYYMLLERLLAEEELNEFSSMSGGNVGGVSVPLGAGPRGKVVYKKSKKKKKVKPKSVQWYLKNNK
jgi:hypothetical protein